MKKLLLLRHGNAASPGSGMADYDRPLNSRGQKEISNIAYKLAENKLIPDLIITSTAVRAFSSAGIVRNIIWTPDRVGGDKGGSLTGTEVLYSASISEYIDILKFQKESILTILIVAHNPAISGFSSRMTGKHIGMGTGNLCSIEINIEKWSEIRLNSPVLSSTLLKP